MRVESSNAISGEWRYNEEGKWSLKLSTQNSLIKIKNKLMSSQENTKEQKGSSLKNNQLNLGGDPNIYYQTFIK